MAKLVLVLDSGLDGVVVFEFFNCGMAYPPQWDHLHRLQGFSASTLNPPSEGYFGLPHSDRHHPGSKNQAGPL